MFPLSAKSDVVVTRFSALCLLVCLLGVLAQSLSAVHSSVWVGAPLLLIFVAINMSKTSTVVRVFFAIAVLLMVTAGFTPVDSSHILAGLERMQFLGALLTALGFMRVVASHDSHFARAGHFLSVQPPSRRYLSMYLGGHLFTTLLNMGGLALLVETIVTAMDRRRSSMSEYVFRLRQRRIVSAIMRGFSTIALWTPFGIGLNSMLLVFTDLHWIDIAPFGLLFAAAALLFGWLLDGAERRIWPLVPAPERIPAEPGGRWSTVLVVIHVVALGAGIFVLDTLLPMSFQAVLLFVVPLYALVWICWLYGFSGPVTLSGEFVRRAPSFVTEIGVFSLAGLLGPMLVALIPEASIDPVFSVLGDHPMMLAIGLMWITVLVSVVGIHPIISVIILGELVLRNGGLSDLAAMLALLAGWACAVTVAPFATTAVFIGRLVDQGVWRVTWGWNGYYSLGLMVLFSLMLCGAMALGLL